MCYATKRKIADCVKQLMKKKEIRKITIQDIMDETKMSRQSFYYHFKDIYDVMEWIISNDFVARVAGKEEEPLETWTMHLLEVIDEERSFLNRVVNQIEWPKLIPSIAPPIEQELHQRLQGSQAAERVSVDMDFCIHFATIAYCYYLMDYVYHKKSRSDEQIKQDVHSMVRMIEGSPMLQNVPVELALAGARMAG